MKSRSKAITSSSSAANHGIFVIGMLKPGVTPRQAQDNLSLSRIR